MTVTNTTPDHRPLFERLSDEDLLKVAKHHSEKWDRAWHTSMTTHYKSGRHICAQDDMKRIYEVLGHIVDHAYNDRPAAFYDSLCEAINWEPRKV